MKTSLFTLASLSFFLMIASCKKENASTTENPSNPTTKLVRIQEGNDPDLNNDTVFLFKYDDSSHLTAIVDSIDLYTTTITTNSSGNPLTVDDGYGQTANYTYDANGVITQLDYMMGGSHEQDVFEYTGGLLSKRTHNTNLGSGPLKLSETFTYTFTGGNITSMSEFDLNGTLVQTTTLTYGTTPNTLKTLGLLNYGNLRGAQTIASLETYFNKNLLSGYTRNSLTNSNAYTLNASQQPIHIVSTDNIEGGVYTWFFSYQ